MFKDATQTAMSGKLDEFKVRVTAVQAGQELTKEEREEWTQTQSTFFEPKKPGEKPSYEVSPQWPWGIVLPLCVQLLAIRLFVCPTALSAS